MDNTFLPAEVFVGHGAGPYMESSVPLFSDFVHAKFKAYCELSRSKFYYHRKLWEFAFIHEHIARSGLLKEGSRGLGFGVGEEPLPSVFASQGCTIVATDAPSDVADQGWTTTGQHASHSDHLFKPDIIDRDLFAQRVSFDACDMNAIPARLKNFDFCWSACCLEHLGSLQHGLDFIVNSLDTLRPGGVACHTTEFNLSSNSETYVSPTLSIYRRCDIEALERQLTERGHTVTPITIALGTTPIDFHVDLPPYSPIHMKIRLSEFVTTSIGIVVRKA